MKMKSCQRPRRHYVLKPLTMLLLGVFGYQLQPASAATADTTQIAFNDVDFNSSLVDLPAENKGSMLQRFSNANTALPGSYRVDLYVNDYWVARRDIQVRDNKSGGSYICFTPTLLTDLNLEYTRVPDAKTLQALPAGDCIDLPQQLPGAAISFNSGDLRMDVNVPQIFLRRQARGYVSPDLWSPGVPLAGFLSYNLNASRNNPDDGATSSQYFLSAQAGINLGVWRLRHSSALTQQLSGEDQSARYQRLSTYAQRDLPDWHATLTLGETYTPSEFFSSVPFRGMLLRSDDRMLPDSQTGYAPVIRGVADSNAKVTVKQRDSIIYETTVPPGQFQIDDMYNTGYAGDLEVTITETDGRIKQFTLPYASVPQLLRPGFSRYSLAAGEIYAGRGTPHPSFVQGTYQRGINNSLTMFGGALGSNRYFSAVMGAAVSSSLGAFSADVTHSQALFDSNTQALPHQLQGQSYRLTYSKLLNATNTNLMLAAYRYSTQGFMEFSDFNYAQQYGARYQPMKSRFSVNMNQPFAEGWGSLTLTGSTQEYWDRSGRDTQYVLNYNNTYRKWLNYGVTASRTKSATGEHTNQYMLSFSIPLEKVPTSPMLTASYTSDSEHNRSQQVSISGSAGELRNFNYSAYANGSHSNNSNTESYGVYASYAGSKGTLSGSFSQSSTSSQQMLGLSGGMVFHPGGITLAQSLGETMAVIEAKGAEGAAVGNMPGTRIDGSGYAVATNLQPYRMNDVSVDPKGMSDDVELQSSSASIAPNSGAIVMLKFPTTSGKAVMVNLKLKSGESVPLGADVLAENGEGITMVGQSGRAFLRGQEGKLLQAKWGNGDKQRCSFRYQVPADSQSNGSIRNTESVCE